MNSALPGRHPGDDVLADLAAEVLPEAQARTIEAHVIGCQRCAGLLADAESVRRLLVTDDPGPMPPEVLARIESALQAEATARAAGVERPADPAPAGPGTQTGPPPTGIPAPWESEWAVDTEMYPSPLAAPARPGRAPRSVRPAGGGPRSRRDVRPERARPVRRRGTMLLGAAAAVAVVAMVGVAIDKGTGGADTSSASLAQTTSGQAPAGPQEAADTYAAVRFVTSSSAYTGKNLASQARKVLLRGGNSSPELSSKSPGGPQSPSSRRTELTPLALGLQDPVRLSACIKALNRQDAPIAVDLARFEGREAAIVLLPTRDGGYEVWAVDPTCGPEGDGVLAFETLPAS